MRSFNGDLIWFDLQWSSVFLKPFALLSSLSPVQPHHPENVTVTLEDGDNPYLQVKWEKPQMVDTRSGWVTLSYELCVKREKDNKSEVRAEDWTILLGPARPWWLFLRLDCPPGSARPRWLTPVRESTHSHCITLGWVSCYGNRITCSYMEKECGFRIYGVFVYNGWLGHWQDCVIHSTQKQPPHPPNFWRPPVCASAASLCRPTEALPDLQAHTWGGLCGEGALQAWPRILERVEFSGLHESARL